MAHYTKGTRSHLIYIVLPLLVGPWFQVYFTPLNGVLFTFPSRYWYTIGRCYVFSLGGWSPQIQTRFHVPRPTQEHARLTQNFAYGAITHYGRTFQSVQLFFVNTISQSYNPKEQALWFGLFPFRSPLLRESHRFLFLWLLRCFNSPRLPHTPMYSVYDTLQSRVGFPIRRPPVQCLLSSSPKIIAGSRVLHRRTTPRHPPWTLIHLTNVTLKHW